MIVLASGSPRRRQLLDMIGLEFRVVPPDVDESLGPSEQPEGYVTRLAREKATTVAARERGAARQGRRVRDPGQGRGAGGGDSRRLFRCDGTTVTARARPARALRCALSLHPVDGELFRLSLDLNRVERLDARGPLQLLEERL